MKVLELINSLKKAKQLRIVCPGCGEALRVSKFNLFTEDHLSQGALEFREEQLRRIQDLKKELNELKKLRLERVQRGARSSNLGKILEKFVPILPGFKHHPEDCIALLDPIDYVAFNGLSKDKIDSLTFMDVKTGNGRLGSSQKIIKEIVESGEVKLEIIKRNKK